MVARYAIGVGLGALITFLLFFLMQAIIATDEAKLDEGVKGKLLDFVRLQDDQEVETKQRVCHHRRRMNRRPICPSQNLSPLTCPKAWTSAR